METPAYLQRITMSTVNSYAQVFFSRNRIFALLLLGVSFIDVYAGLSGMLAVIFTTLAALFFGLDHTKIASGMYGFNSLLVGLGLGIYYQPGLEFYLVVLLASLLTLFISVSMEGIIGKYYLPYLSVPFILSIWIVLLATRQFETLGISERGIYTLNELYGLGGQKLVSLWEKLNQAFPTSLKLYFLSVAAIFFQSQVIAGILIAIGLFFYSRIAFTLSLIGFYTAYLFYLLLGVNLAETSYSYIGFNYILTAIALGGFYLIPSVWSYLWVILLTPLVAILTISLDPVFAVFHLPVYALPFNIMVLLFLYVLKFRTTGKKHLKEVYIQQYSPEKNLYYEKNYQNRFYPQYIFSFRLPFNGKWKVSQGHKGTYTHQGEWQHAWDFVIEDTSGKTFRDEGNLLTDYYCYDKDVVAPGHGTVEELEDGIDDNDVGKINLVKNWGNTVVVKHTDYLYSQMSHLKKGSIRVKKGDRVKPGDIIGKTGNSGRSPYPHLHFQFQETPYIGSKTLLYPFGSYLTYRNGKPHLATYDIPAENDLASNPEVNELMKKTFRFIPGQKLRFEPVSGSVLRGSTWEVKVTPYNHTYFLCTETGSKAWFISEDTRFYFTGFEGNKKSLLYYFFLAAYRVYPVFYKEITIKDNFSLHLVYNHIQLLLQDFLSPFVLFCHADYRLNYMSIDNPVIPSVIQLESSARTRIGKYRQPKEIRFTLEITGRGITHFTIIRNNKKTTVKCTD